MKLYEIYKSTPEDYMESHILVSIYGELDEKTATRIIEACGWQVRKIVPVEPLESVMDLIETMHKLNNRENS